MIQIKTDFAIEMKNEIERLYLLTREINTNGAQTITTINEPKSANGIKYIQEVDKYERPYLYYHCQLGIYNTEMRKGRKDYYVRTNFECKIEKMREDTTLTKRKWGNKIRFEYYNDYEYTLDNYTRTIIDLLEMKRAIKENLLIW